MLDRMTAGLFVTLVIGMLLGSLTTVFLLNLGMAKADHEDITLTPTSDFNPVGTDHLLTATISSTSSAVLVTFLV